MSERRLPRLFPSEAVHWAAIAMPSMPFGVRRSEKNALALKALRRGYSRGSQSRGEEFRDPAAVGSRNQEHAAPVLGLNPAGPKHVDPSRV